MNWSTFFRWKGVWLAWGESTVFVVPILLGMALLARRRPANVRGAKLLVFAVLTTFLWRLLYAWSMRGGIRYQALPVVLAIPLAISGLYLTRRIFCSKFKATLAALALTAAMLVAGTLKICRAPKSDKRSFIAAAAAVLRAEKGGGIVFDNSSAATRLSSRLPEFEFVCDQHRYIDDPLFWRDLQDFIRKRQVEGKQLYVLLQTPHGRGDRGMFREIALREWGMVPFVSLSCFEDANASYELLRYQPPRRLFGLNVSTPERPDPDGPFLPPEIAIRRGTPYRLEFSGILSDLRYAKWGGVEVDVRFGEADDRGWSFTPGPEAPESFPLAVTLYAPNNWPTGYAATTIRVVDHPVPVLPERSEKLREIDWDERPEGWARSLPIPSEVPGDADTMPCPRPGELANLPGDGGDRLPPFRVRMVEQRELDLPIFWIGSRVWGTPWITDKLAKAHPKLRIFRLEDHPKLSYSADPRYTFFGLTTRRAPENPLLNARGAIDWGRYRRRQNLPELPVVVLALGYEETTWLVTRHAFHIETAEAALRAFLEDLRRSSPGSRVLLILPGMPSLRQKDYSAFTANPYLSGFRRVRRHGYRRLVEMAYRVAGEHPELVVMPTYLWLPAGSSERDPMYQRVIQLYLRELGNTGSK